VVSTARDARGAILALALSSASGGGSASAPTPPVPIPPPTPPSFVVVVTDDLDVPTAVELPRLPDLMANQGLSFTRAYVAESLCAPSRASIRVPIPDCVDGRSLAPFLRGKPPASRRTEVEIENFGADFSYVVRTPDWMYNNQDTDEIELYDMKADPYPLKNLHRTADPALLASFESKIKAFVACHGASCRG